MLYSVELQLKVVDGDSSGLVTGYHLYSFFLHLIEGVNSSLASRLHEDSGLKPFTISSLALAEQKHRRVLIKEGDSVRFRLTFLQEEVFASLADAVLRTTSSSIFTLGDIKVACDNLVTVPSQSPWAAFSSFQELIEEAGDDSKIRLAFLSPTTFRSKGERNILFPEPSLVFGSLSTRWNAYAPADLNIRLGENYLSAIRLSGYKLATRMIDFGNYQELGFCGQAMYEYTGKRSDDIRALNALAAFSWFSGLGPKTTMGMGQCRRLENASSISHRAGRNPEKRRRSSPGD